jgi:hypothetical protein
VVLYVASIIALLALPFAILAISAWMKPEPFLLDPGKLGAVGSSDRSFPDGTTVRLRACTDEGVARREADALASTNTRLVRAVGNYVIDVRGPDRVLVESHFRQLPFVVENPRFSQDGDLTTRYPLGSLIALFVFCFVWVSWIQIAGTLAAFLDAEPGVVPVAEAVLRERVLALNALDVPLQVELDAGGRLVAGWRPAKSAESSRRSGGVTLRLAPRKHRARAIVDSAGGSTPAPG